MPSATSAQKPRPSISSAEALTAKTALVPWMSPECTGINRLRAHATLLPYRSRQAAILDRGAEVVSLDGQWRFALLQAVEDTPASFPQPGFDDSAWSDIAVPGNWTMQGFAQPHYTNVVLPFSPAVPPLVPRENPTGLYRTSFPVPPAWAGRRVVLQFGGVENCFSVWVNGAPVGFGKDSRLPSAFDITSSAGAWAQHPRRAGAALVGHLLCRGPGPLAAVGHPSQRAPVCHRAHLHRGCLLPRRL